jgi:hypothetical protein
MTLAADIHILCDLPDYGRSPLQNIEFLAEYVVN